MPAKTPPDDQSMARTLRPLVPSSPRPFNTRGSISRKPSRFEAVDILRPIISALAPDKVPGIFASRSLFNENLSDD